MTYQDHPDNRPDDEGTHTPGPWTVQRDGQGNLLVAGGVNPDPTTNARYLWVAKIPQTRHEDPLWRQEEESDANARLIAAAPDLLAAAKDAWEALFVYVDEEDGPFTSETDPLLISLGAAINKAVGR